MTGAPRASSRRRIAGVGAALVLLAAGLAWLENREFVQAARRSAGARSLDAAAFPSQPVMLGLRRMGLLFASLPRADGRADFATRLDHLRLGLDAPPAAALAEQLGVDPEWLERPVAVAALLVDPAALERLYARPRQRGPEWEIPGYFTWFEAGTPAYASRVAVRLHGNWVRRYREIVGYRIYFRRREGAYRLPAELVPGLEGAGPSRLVLRHDGRHDPWGRFWQWGSPLSLDVARQVGCPTPPARVVTLYVNGEHRGVRVASEHLSLDYFRDHYGHTDFALFDSKRSNHAFAQPKAGKIDEYRALGRLVREANPLTVEGLAERVDLDNLFRWYATTLFLGTVDRFQGFLARDLTDARSRWFWTVWDLDQSFGKGLAPPRPAWEMDNFADDQALRNTDLRALIFRRLAGDGRFRADLTGVLVEVMNHRLTDEFLAERIAHYRRLALDHDSGPSGQRAVEDLAQFLARRKAVLRRQLDEHFGAGETYRLCVQIPAGRRLLIDGHPYSSGYCGWYFGSTPAHLRLAGRDRARLGHWVVNGERREGHPELALALRENTLVEPVFER